MRKGPSSGDFGQTFLGGTKATKFDCIVKFAFEINGYCSKARRFIGDKTIEMRKRKADALMIRPLQEDAAQRLLFRRHPTRWFDALVLDFSSDALAMRRHGKPGAGATYEIYEGIRYICSRAPVALGVNGGVKTGHGAEQKSATVGAA